MVAVQARMPFITSRLLNSVAAVTSNSVADSGIPVSLVRFVPRLFHLVLNLRAASQIDDVASDQSLVKFVSLPGPCAAMYS